jgi:ATP-dependent DNA helicase DinG
VAKTYKDHFPVGFTPTDSQVVVLDRIEKAFKSNKKFVICCAPTGSGKSFIARTLANLSNEPSDEFRRLITSYEAYKKDFEGGYTYAYECTQEPAFGTFALTITKTLQDQYQGLFNDTSVLKGKTNYRCDIDDNFDTEIAPCTFAPRIKDQCWGENRCPYYNARNDALTSTFTTLNYKMFLALPDHLKRKQFIVCDEASELEDEIVRQFSAEIIYEKLDFYNIPYKTLVTDNQQRALNWLTELASDINNEVEMLAAKAINKNKHVTLTQSEQIKYNYLKNLHRSIVSLISLWDKGEYVIEVDSKKVLITPLRADFLADSIFNFADKIVLLSATIIDHKNFAKSLGIKDYEYVEVESGFDPKKSPIYICSKYKLNHGNLMHQLPGVCSYIEQILDQHKNEKGIIHTHTFEITEFIKNRIYNERFLIRDTNRSNEDILKIHTESTEPTVLVSPSMVYGIDLKDDLARFQVIVKLPFLSLGSKRVKQLFELDKNWYENKMLNSVVQAAGRATRNQEDYSTTYILDGNFVGVVMRAKNKLPKHFIERIH